MDIGQRKELSSMTVLELVSLAHMDRDDPCSGCPMQESNLCLECTDSNPYLQTQDGVTLYPNHARLMLKEIHSTLSKESFIR